MLLLVKDLFYKRGNTNYITKLFHIEKIFSIGRKVLIRLHKAGFRRIERDL